MEPQLDPIDEAALEYLDSVLVLPFSQDARRVAFEFLHRRDHPDAIQEQRGGLAFQYALAQGNGVEVLRRAERLARARGLGAVDDDSVRAAILQLCPGFYPFC